MEVAPATKGNLRCKSTAQWPIFKEAAGSPGFANGWAPAPSARNASASWNWSDWGDQSRILPMVVHARWLIWMIGFAMMSKSPLQEFLIFYTLYWFKHEVSWMTWSMVLYNCNVWGFVWCCMHEIIPVASWRTLARTPSGKGNCAAGDSCSKLRTVGDGWPQGTSSQ